MGLYSLQILSVVGGQGRTHDVDLLKRSRLRIAPAIEKYTDSGYQGLAKRDANSVTPLKKPRGRELTADERAHNRALARLRIVIEHVNRRCKIFRSVKETYRGTHRQYHNTWTVVAAFVNLRYAE
ncbi:transposase IS4 family protein [Candidatus Moduliflexus flocculans]|uniref:Transposase IS4 family protein n=1 Tax=Candidatus Moduliflexus flocculans TaxID=1499966 RepID=A0A081BL86_9BACT|nr:transposase IS4 family protein [Candidatus Moduliflexus flocculans]